MKELCRLHVPEFRLETYFVVLLEGVQERFQILHSVATLMFIHIVFFVSN